MKIQSIEVIGLACKLTAGKIYGSSVGLHTHRRASLIRLRTEDGIEGIGDVRAPVGFVRAAIEMMKPAFIGSNLHDRDAVFNRFFNSVYHMGHQGALIAAYSGLNIAMLDALGKGLGLPVYKLLGGKVSAEVPVYATGGHFTLKSEADLVPQMEELRALGVAGVKIKIGMGVDSDAERAATARRVIGDDIFLAVDANANYTADLALESMRRMAPYRIEWFEEPLKPYDYAGLHVPPLARNHAGGRRGGALYGTRLSAAAERAVHRYRTAGGLRVWRSRRSTADRRALPPLWGCAWYRPRGRAASGWSLPSTTRPRFFPIMSNSIRSRSSSSSMPKRMLCATRS